MTCVTPRSSTSIDTPLLLQDDSPSLASSSDSASPSLRQPRSLYNISKSPLGAETFFDMPPTPESDWYADLDTGAIVDEMAHSIHNGGSTPRTPLKKIRKVMRNVFPPKSPRHARVARSTAKSGTAPTHFPEN
ncbi:hypothetical protein FIBSPDRAFT_277351 [Athelia psychrophila]|uniref:Uncharacterized protein n=1 Tax=Athelia psychrophila TaxID=1759441 RepID=A0A165WPN5_9AGAM|nr:hypothetical protein FIBSPDRAFT_277351 [Fibularhizoctonia sp. CBS 109695]